MSSTANLIRAKGLVTFSNELSVPEGALVIADNVNVDEQGVITPRRGFEDYGDALPSDSDRLKQIRVYKDRLIRHYSSTLQFDNGSGTFTDFNGSFSEIEEGFRLKFQEANSNFYFTSNSGIKKISETSASNINADSVEAAGVDKALDIDVTTSTSVTGFMPPESKTAYRVLFGKRDNNNNLLLGSPSSRFVVTNSSAVDNANTSITFTIPENIDTTYFYQVYRTTTVEVTGSLTLDDIDPGDEMRQVLENPVTSSDITAGEITVSDETPENFRINGPNLYTNEITGNGILQANDPPPLAKDIELFRNSMFYANTKLEHQLSLTFISVANFTAGTTEIIIGNSSTVRRYVFDNTEDASIQQALLSSSPSVAQAIDETARSFARVVNKDPSGIAYVDYLSGANDLPGQLRIRARNMTDDEFYVLTNDSAVQSSFNPQLPEIETVSTVEFESGGSGDNAKFTSAGHGLSTGNEVYLNSPDTTPAFSGKFSVTVLNANEFVVDQAITGEDLVGTNAFWNQPTVESDNVEAKNRVYYSKDDQPEAVPLTNFVNVGEKDEPVERIIALRDNLFVLKTDGIFIIDGVTSPNFSVRLLENTTNIVAPDSAVVLNNQIYCLTTQGVATITETGVAVISRTIEDKILAVANDRFNFRLPTFGVAYESDRAYFLWLPTDSTDSSATQCYRYNYFERTWTRWVFDTTCGVVNPANGRLYYGLGNRNVMYEERKNGDRTDYSDRSFSRSISADGVEGNRVAINSLTDIEVGDVIVQEQFITLIIYNRLLKKLDIDGGLDDTDYFSSLEMSPGDNIQLKMNSLNSKILADDSSGTVTARVYSSDFETLRSEFNDLMAELNDVNCDTFFKDYKQETERTYPYEFIIEDTVRNTTIVVGNYAQNFIEGPITVYKNINKQIRWSPQHFGNPSLLKQIRETTIMFDQNNFYSATSAYSSDLSQGFVDIPFNGSGIGTWGSALWGNRDPEFYWGGDGNDRPFRAIVPREKQRCRYLNCEFRHINAREDFRIVGISAVVRPLSTRAYR